MTHDQAIAVAVAISVLILAALLILGAFWFSRAHDYPELDEHDPDAGDDYIERKIREKGLVAPRITPDDIEAVIAGEEYHQFHGTTVTVCCLTLANGYNVIGESACASPENFDAELGREIARTNAKAKIWALEGYLLRAQLHDKEA